MRPKSRKKKFRKSAGSAFCNEADDMFTVRHLTDCYSKLVPGSLE